MQGLLLYSSPLLFHPDYFGKGGWGLNNPYPFRRRLALQEQMI